MPTLANHQATASLPMSRMVRYIKAHKDEIWFAVISALAAGLLFELIVEFALHLKLLPSFLFGQLVQTLAMKVNLATVLLVSFSLFFVALVIQRKYKEGMDPRLPKDVITPAEPDGEDARLEPDEVTGHHPSPDGAALPRLSRTSKIIMTCCILMALLIWIELRADGHAPDQHGNAPDLAATHVPPGNDLQGDCLEDVCEAEAPPPVVRTATHPSPVKVSDDATDILEELNRMVIDRLEH